MCKAVAVKWGELVPRGKGVPVRGASRREQDSTQAGSQVAAESGQKGGLMSPPGNLWVLTGLPGDIFGNRRAFQMLKSSAARSDWHTFHGGILRI